MSDPVCGMKVDRAKALHVDFAGQTFYFCSQHCLHAFEAKTAEHLEHGSSAITAGHAGSHRHRH